MARPKLIKKQKPIKHENNVIIRPLYYNIEAFVCTGKKWVGNSRLDKNDFCHRLVGNRSYRFARDVYLRKSRIPRVYRVLVSNVFFNTVNDFSLYACPSTPFIRPTQCSTRRAVKYSAICYLCSLHSMGRSRVFWY